MKIRLSLRLYFLLGMLILGTSIVAGFSVVAANNFIEGLDSVSASTLIETAKRTEIFNDQVSTNMDIMVAGRWQDLPEEITRRFAQPPDQFFTLYKYIKQKSWFHRPTELQMVMKVKLANGQVRFAARSYIMAATTDKTQSLEFNNKVVTTVFLGLMVSLVFALLLLLMMRNIATPVEKLRDWARQLSADNLKSPAPDFRYSELNALAELFRTSLTSVQYGLEREQDFLRHASHELRTPIAVVRSNVELLKRLLPEPLPKQQAVIQRIENAGFTMSDLTETLLWLSRENELPNVTQEIDLQQLLQQLADDLSYLIKGKQIKLHLNCETFILKSNVAACRMVFANLIRNAYQHTQAGWVHIQQFNHTVIITNHNDNTYFDKPDELGFGLGLALTEKLTRRLGWYYLNQSGPWGHNVEVRIQLQH